MDERHGAQVERGHRKDAADRVIDPEQHRYDHAGRGHPEKPASRTQLDAGSDCQAHEPGDAKHTGPEKDRTNDGQQP